LSLHEDCTDARCGPSLIQFVRKPSATSGSEWAGTNKDKGLGVFSFTGMRLRRHQLWDQRFHLFLPVEIRGAHMVNLLAVWAFNHRTPPGVTMNPITTSAAIEYYAEFLRAEPSVVAGDFNSNVIWDRPGKPSSFSNVTSRLDELGLCSCYHGVSGEEFGAEKQHTLWWQRKEAQGYHVDYVFAPSNWKKRCRLNVGDAGTWLGRSDHAPLIVEFADH
jgi:exodeoxyribonuclease-3